MRPARRGRVLGVLGAAALLLPGAAAGAAVAPTALAAEPQFRYWTYWTGTADGWQFSPVGPAFRDVEDGVVEGWRLAVTGVAATAAPRVDPAAAFAQACDAVPPSDGRVRIAVVIDYGTAADAPAGQTPPGPRVLCTEVTEGQTGFDALRAVAPIRSERGLICGLDGYPRTGCAERIDAAADAGADPTPRPQDPEPNERSTAAPAPTPAPGPVGPTADSIADPSSTPATQVASPPVPSASADADAPAADLSAPGRAQAVASPPAQSAAQSGSQSGSGPWLAAGVLSTIGVLVFLAVRRARRSP